MHPAYCHISTIYIKACPISILLTVYKKTFFPFFSSCSLATAHDCASFSTPALGKRPLFFYSKALFLYRLNCHHGGHCGQLSDSGKRGRLTCPLWCRVLNTLDDCGPQSAHTQVSQCIAILQVIIVTYWLSILAGKRCVGWHCLKLLVAPCILLFTF